MPWWLGLQTQSRTPPKATCQRAPIKSFPHFRCGILPREDTEVSDLPGSVRPRSHPIPGAGSPSSYLSDPQPIHLQVLFCLFVLFLFSVNISLLFWTCRDQLRSWSRGEGEDDWVFLFFPFSLGFWCLNLKKK